MIEYERTGETYILLSLFILIYMLYIIMCTLCAATLMERIGHTVSRVPQFFIDGIYSGGYNDLVTSIEGLQSTGSA